jgi:hypothetical protein
VETDYTGDSFREKTIEKTILRVLGSSEFSHSLDPKRTSLLCAAKWETNFMRQVLPRRTVARRAKI